jgi:hypothetical protein
MLWTRGARGADNLLQETHTKFVDNCREAQGKFEKSQIISAETGEIGF